MRHRRRREGSKRGNISKERNKERKNKVGQ
jgi:hypothetical protein